MSINANDGKNLIPKIEGVWREDLGRALESDPNMPLSRGKLAIPFVGGLKSSLIHLPELK